MAEGVHTLRKDRGANRPGPGDAAPESADDTAPRTDDRIYCAACGHPLTRARWRTARNGAHEHVVFNPAGMLFRIGCFSSVDGALPVGLWSDLFTWFKGHAWRIALCAECRRHVGWEYDRSSGPSGFFALILDRLKQDPGPL